MRSSSERRTATAEREVILCGGAINSPQLLQLSGIGPADLLSRLGIAVRRDLPGVGANLSDHPDIVIQHACTQPVTLAPKARAPGKYLTGLQWFLNKSRAPRRPIISRPAASSAAAPGSSIPICNSPSCRWRCCRARSRPARSTRSRSISTCCGPRAWATSKRAAPIRVSRHRSGSTICKARATARISGSASQLLREILAQPALAPYRGAELFPGPGVRSKDEIDAWVRQAVETCYHPVGTCRMGMASEHSAVVVDDALRVHGIDGLRVVDASIMPSIVSGNTNAPTIMIAERAADLIRGQRPLPPAEAPVWINPNWESAQR